MCGKNTLPGVAMIYAILPFSSAILRGIRFLLTYSSHAMLDEYGVLIINLRS